MIFRLAQQSLANRWITALLTILAIALSVMLLLGVEKIRTGARASFANTISGTDLIVGARSGSMQLLLYSVFRIGNATNNMTWRSYKDIAAGKEVKWIVPLSLGDSHKGFRVMGTSKQYFEHYRFRDKRQLVFGDGGVFDDLFDVVIGADVAQNLGYRLDDKIVVAHGIGSIGAKHDDMPFRIAGILKKTGTPVDKTLHVSLNAIEAIHVDWQAGYKVPGQATPADRLRAMKLRPKAITAALVGLNSRMQVFGFQRYVNTYKVEPLSAVLPGLALHEMWALVGTAEKALMAVSAMVVITAILGMMTMILSTLNERRREIAILRSLGAGPRTIVALLVSEAGILTALGVVLGTICLYGVLIIARPIIDTSYGINIEISALGITELQALGAILAGGFLAGLLPAWRAYRLSLADGMMVRA
ncbi:MAG: FtsX-like permease family protein [Hyphomicrobiales bacterium]|nr:FtsX-like permease family protein [Hyphomicrobiales bacterium]